MAMRSFVRLYPLGTEKKWSKLSWFQAKNALARYVIK